MITIYIDNKPYEVDEKRNLLDTALSLGFNLPYFCWHPAMHSVGACRQCAVKEFKDEKDTRGRLVMACMTPLKQGMRVSIDDPEAKAFRASIIEWFMTYHPHDCPVCDEGSECHLQDMTLMTGHDYRRFRFKKITYNNQYLGPFVTHEMNRCIKCYRCVRFYRDYAGGRDFDVFGPHNEVFFGRYEDGVLESEFAGNLVEICPTGVFDDKTFWHHYTRKWDLQTAPSLCVHCPIGCNTIPGERYNLLRRIRTRYNGEVNNYFLCDRGRYGYDFVNSEKRIRRPFLNASQGIRHLTRQEAMEYIKGHLHFGVKVVGIGSPRASLESNFALRSLVGHDNFYSGMSTGESHLVAMMLSILQNGPAHSPSLHEVESADVALVLGEDLPNRAPLLALALRQTARQQLIEYAEKLHIPKWDDYAVRYATQTMKGPLFLATPYKTKIEDIATQIYHAPPDGLARLGFAIAHALGSDTSPLNLSEEEKAMVEGMAKTLREAKRPLIISGSGCNSEAVIQAAANIAWALSKGEKPALLSLVPSECNSFGLGLMEGKSLAEVFTAAEQGDIDVAIILENDLYRRAEKEKVDAFLRQVEQVIVLDQLETRTTNRAHLVLSAAAFAESDGTLVNNEGRAQRFYQVFVPEGIIYESWRWLGDMKRTIAPSEQRGEETLDAITNALASAFPQFKEVTSIAPPEGFRIAGMKISRQPHRYSGRTAIFANMTVHEPKPPDDPDSSLSFSMEGYEGENTPAPLIPRFWSPGWNSVQAINKFQSEVGGPLHGGDPGRRLIEPAQNKEVRYFKEIPQPFARRKGEWFIIPLYHVFGSEQLSNESRYIKERIPKPYAGINPDDAQAFGVLEGDTVMIKVNNAVYHLPVKLMPELQQGTAGIPIDLPGMEWIPLPQWGTMSV